MSNFVFSTKKKNCIFKIWPFWSQVSPWSICELSQTGHCNWLSYIFRTQLWLFWMYFAWWWSTVGCWSQWSALPTDTQSFSILSIPVYSQSCSWWWQTMYLVPCILISKYKNQISTRHSFGTLKKICIHLDHLALCRLWPSLPVAAYFLWLTGGPASDTEVRLFTHFQKTLMVLDQSAQEQDVTY